MSEQPKRESRTERQARTRAELLATAAKVFAARGYDGASVEEIAEVAGYSHGAVYSNFDGKADLFLAVFEDYMAERARALADQWMERLERDPDSFTLHMEFIAHASRDPELAHRFGTRSAALREAVAYYIAEYEREAETELVMSPADLAMIVRSLGIGLAMEALVSPDAVRKDLYGDFVEMLIAIFK